MDFFTLSPYAKPISKLRIKPGSRRCILRLRIPPGRMGTVVLALSLLSTALLCPATAVLRIGAFNIQAFGDSKMSDESVADVIINVSTAGAAWSTWGWAVRRGRAGTSAPALMGLCDTVG